VHSVKGDEEMVIPGQFTRAGDILQQAFDEATHRIVHHIAIIDHSYHH
jgi:hypothetical protein